MARTVRRTLELAGALSELRALLKKPHIVEIPRRRHRLRDVLLVGSAIAAGAVVAAVVCGRRAGALRSDVTAQSVPAPEHDGQGAEETSAVETGAEETTALETSAR